MRSNFEAAYSGSAYALPVLRTAGGGSIVNISSTAALHGTWGTYSIAKAAIEALTRALAVQGGVGSNSRQRAVAFLAFAEASFVTGQTLIVDGGLTLVDYPSQPWLKGVGAWKSFSDLKPRR